MRFEQRRRGAVLSFRTSDLKRGPSETGRDFASKKKIDLFSFSCFLTQISLDAKVRAEIDNNMNNPTEDTFKVAQDHIFTLMYHDCFPRFIKSKHYKQLLKRHWSNKDPNPRIAFVTKSFDLTIQPSLDIKLFRRNLELYAQQRHPIYYLFSYVLGTSLCRNQIFQKQERSRLWLVRDGSPENWFWRRKADF